MFGWRVSSCLLLQNSPECPPPQILMIKGTIEHAPSKSEPTWLLYIYTAGRKVFQSRGGGVMSPSVGGACVRKSPRVFLSPWVIAHYSQMRMRGWARSVRRRQTLTKLTTSEQGEQPGRQVAVISGAHGDDRKHAKDRLEMFGIKRQLSAGRGRESGTQSDFWGDSRVKHKETRDKSVCVCVCVCVWERERERERAQRLQHQQSDKAALPPTLTSPAGYRGSSAPPLTWSLRSALDLYWLEFTCWRRSAVKVGHWWRSQPCFLSVKRCSEEEHAARQFLFCLFCFLNLVFPSFGPLREKHLSEGWELLLRRNSA